MKTLEAHYHRCAVAQYLDRLDVPMLIGEQAEP